uniref:Endonuclease/exonuclease/phosphatase domain-containing protein n=1 Tax=Pygocentrus nattereri TaxID=42514 RepID=A0AAR2IW08_PYGNA
SSCSHHSKKPKISTVIPVPGRLSGHVNTVSLGRREFSLLNIYAPNEDCPKFMTDKITLFSQYTSDFGIIAGDFNCCMDSNLDKSSMLTSNPNASRTLSVSAREAGLVDVWREFNPTSKDYTFYSARHKTYSRLDFFLLP